MRRHVPTTITVLRLFLGPAFLLSYHGAGTRPLALAGAFGLIVFAIFSDWLDGYLARRWEAVSSVGKLLDPFADALFCMTVFYAFKRLGLMPAWIVWALIGREATVTFVLRPLALSRGVVIAARMMGKVKTSFQFGAMITVLVAHVDAMPAALGWLQWLALRLEAFGFYAVLVLSLTSGFRYLLDVAAAVREPRTGSNPGEKSV